MSVGRITVWRPWRALYLVLLAACAYEWYGAGAAWLVLFASSDLELEDRE